MSGEAPRGVVALAITGSIAAFKAPMVARLLMKEDVRVVAVMSRSAREFVGAQTLAGLTGEAVHEEMFDAAYAGEKHIDLAKTADVVAVVPATADFLARTAMGRADDLVAALVLSARGPVIAAPAMHPRMWSHPATQRNVELIARDGRIALVGPVDGQVASGESGVGRMAEPEVIARAILAALRPKRDLEGLHVVVTAGPTVEDLDAVRFLTNRSTGKMGFAIAERAAFRGAAVTLVSGPVALATPAHVDRVDVRSALSMQAALDEALGADLGKADALVMTAAVGDYRAKHTAEGKLKRSEATWTLELVPNPDLIAAIGARRAGSKPVLVAFAVETDTDERVAALAKEKLLKKKVDLVVANHAKDSFGRDDNRAALVTRDGARALGVLSKRDLADAILDEVSTRITAEREKP